MINNIKETSLFTLCFFHSLEIIQIISFAFSSIHIITWKLSNKGYIISVITSCFRLTPLVQFIPFKIYTFIFFLFSILIFILCLFLVIQIMFRKENSKIYNKFLYFTHILLAPLTIFFNIPIIELFLIPLKCNNNNKIFFSNDSIKCWTGYHYIFVILGILCSLSFFIFLLFLNNFYFYPFQMKSSTIKIN